MEMLCAYTVAQTSYHIFWQGWHLKTGRQVCVLLGNTESYGLMGNGMQSTLLPMPGCLPLSPLVSLAVTRMAWELSHRDHGISGWLLECPPRGVFHPPVRCCRSRKTFCALLHWMHFISLHNIESTQLVQQHYVITSVICTISRMWHSETNSLA